MFVGILAILSKASNYDYNLYLEIEWVYIDNNEVYIDNNKVFCNSARDHIVPIEDPEMAEKIKQFFNSPVILPIDDPNNEHTTHCINKVIKMDELLKLHGKIKIPTIPRNDFIYKIKKDVIEIIEFLEKNFERNSKNRAINSLIFSSHFPALPKRNELTMQLAISWQG